MGAARRPAPTAGHRRRGCAPQGNARDRGSEAASAKRADCAWCAALCPRRFALVEVARAGPDALSNRRPRGRGRSPAGWRAERRAAPMRGASCAWVSRYGRSPDHHIPQSLARRRSAPTRRTPPPTVRRRHRAMRSYGTRVITASASLGARATEQHGTRHEGVSIRCVAGMEHRSYPEQREKGGPPRISARHGCVPAWRPVMTRAAHDEGPSQVVRSDHAERAVLVGIAPRDAHGGRDGIGGTRSLRELERLARTRGGPVASVAADGARISRHLHRSGKVEEVKQAAIAERGGVVARRRGAQPGTAAYAHRALGVKVLDRASSSSTSSPPRRSLEASCRWSSRRSIPVAASDARLSISRGWAAASARAVP